MFHCASLNETLASHKTSGDHDNRYIIADIQHLTVNAYGINFAFIKVGRIVQLYFNGTASQDLSANQEVYITDGLMVYNLGSAYGNERAVNVSDWSTAEMAIIIDGKYLRIRPIAAKISSGDLVRGSIVYISNA